MMHQDEFIKWLDKGPHDNNWPEEFIKFLDDRIEKFTKLAANERGNEYHRFDGKRAELILIREKFLSLTPPPTTLS